MYKIKKEHHFSASHQLEGVPEGHPCGRLHGHNYKVEAVLEGEELTEPGFVRDFGDLDVLWKYIDEELDHHDLNAKLPCRTSAECIARHLYEKAKPDLPELAAVRVSETPKSWATYRPE
jgi:6-pyruvoyltetrahydropterin/6-carboxytetrahydropterin synthase